jgi:hypothetical protein
MRRNWRHNADGLEDEKPREAQTSKRRKQTERKMARPMAFAFVDLIFFSKESLIKCRKSACLEKLPSEVGDIQGSFRIS